MIGKEKHFHFLTIDLILGQFSHKRTDAQKPFEGFVIEGLRGDSLWKSLKGQMFLGEKGFIEQCKRIIYTHDILDEIPLSQRFVFRPPIEGLFPNGIRQDRKKEMMLSTMFVFNMATP